MKNKRPTLTVGITTRYADESLRKAVRSIYDSKNISKFKFIIVADSIPMPKDMLAEFNTLGVKVIENKTPGSQFKKLKQMITLVKTDVFVLTQDDILFDENALRLILEKFENDSKITLIVPHIKSIPAETLFERILEVGIDISYRIGLMWKKRDNYLLANGRCLAFKTDFLKSKFRIPENLINTDAFVYFENKKSGGTFVHLENAIIYNKNPKRLKEHLSQAHRFLISYKEVQKLFKEDLSSEYKIPKSIEIRALIEEFIKNPILTILYLGINIYSKLSLKKSKYNIHWEVAISTKKG